jgi:hypothetical protein
MADDSGIIDGHSMRISNTMHTFDFQDFNESDYLLNDLYHFKTKWGQILAFRDAFVLCMWTNATFWKRRHT